MCPRCHARLYVRLDTAPLVADGEALDHACPG
jgi:hypothetical protein